MTPDRPKKIELQKWWSLQSWRIVDEHSIALDTGLMVRLLGVKVKKKEDVLRYLKGYVLGREVFLRFDDGAVSDGNTVEAYVYLKNKIFINAYLVKSGMVGVDTSKEFRYKRKFLQLEGSK